MDEIRSFTDSDVPEVAALWLRVFGKRTGTAGRDLEEYFRHILLRNPWRDEELPSLIYVRNSKAVAFLGVVPRTMQFRDRQIRVAATTQLMSDPEGQCCLAGLQLLRRAFQGPQDLTFADGATEAGSIAWTAAGGRLARLYSLQWKRVLRPATYLHSLAERRKRSSAFRAAAKVVAPAFHLADRFIAALPGEIVSRPKAEFSSDMVGVDDLLRTIQNLGWRDVLHPVYELNSFRWLIAEAATVRKFGTLRMAVVRDKQGKPVGWYVYYAKLGFDSRVVQIGGRSRHFDQIFLAMMQDAWRQGCSCVSGVVIPRFLLSLTNQYCILRFGSRVVVHTRDPQIMDCILQGEAAFSVLDGEFWMRFAVEDWS